MIKERVTGNKYTLTKSELEKACIMFLNEVGVVINDEEVEVLISHDGAEITTTFTAEEQTLDDYCQKRYEEIMKGG